MYYINIGVVYICQHTCWYVGKCVLSFMWLRLHCDDWLIELHVHRINWQSSVSHAIMRSYQLNSETQPETISVQWSQT